MSVTLHGTTVLCARFGGQVAIGGDGQITHGSTILKANACKVRKIGGGIAIAGFAGATADALALFERLEGKLEQYPKQIKRAAVEMAKDWRTDRYLRKLEAMMTVADKEVDLLISGNGDVVESEDGLLGIGSGGAYALAAARALVARPTWTQPRSCVRRSRSQPAFASIPTERSCWRPCEKILVTQFSPREIVSELDRHIVGQTEAKRAVAIALRNRWRRQQITDEVLKEEIQPKNILMVGPTGCGKTEIARRLAKLAHSPFLKVEATKFTEVGYVGRDVEQIIRDLLETAQHMTREEHRRSVCAQAELTAEKRLIEALLLSDGGKGRSEAEVREKLRAGDLQEVMVEISLNAPQPSFPSFNFGNMQMGAVNLSEMLGKAMGSQTQQQKQTISVEEATPILSAEESNRLLDDNRITREAIERVEQSGIVFIDEMDKICARSEIRGGGDISREGVQRDLLPLIEGTTVSTKYGPVKTDYILFIASGAFHMSKPSDLLPELQGRLPIRVALQALTREDFVRILIEPEGSLVKQYIALLATEGVKINFTEKTIGAIADLAVQMNNTVENIGARRLHTVMEKLLEDVSFRATDMTEKEYEITEKMLDEKLRPLLEDNDLSRFIL